MRNQQNQRRNRGRSNNNNSNNRGGQSGGGYRSNSNGGGMNDSRARGNAQQLLEKYKNMARDAATSGDRVLAEYYMQHADHYFRIVSEFRARFEENRPRDQRGEGDQNDDQGGHSDNYIEGVDSMDLRRPQSFAASVATQSVGADAAPTPPAPRIDNDTDSQNSDRQSSDRNDGHRPEPRNEQPRREQTGREQPRREQPRRDDTRRDSGSRDQANRVAAADDQPRLPPKIHAAPRDEPVAAVGTDAPEGAAAADTDVSIRRRTRRPRAPVADTATEAVES
jgi:Domain of unknown function (DUF4167)